MNKYLTLSLLLILIVKFCVAQNNFGPRLTAMGNSSASVGDIWSVSANPAGIVALKTPTLALNYAKFLFDSELSQQAFALVVPIKNNYLGFNFQRYGISEYNELKGGFALAKNFGNQLAIALKINYHQIKITNYGSSTGFSVDVGVTYTLNDKLTFGAYVNNPSVQKYSSGTSKNTIPTIINIGATYHASDKLLIATTISKDLKKAVDVGLGLEYRIIELLSVRGGLTARPFKQYAGFGLNFKKLTIDMAVQSDPNLGYSPQIALAYAF